MTVSTSMADPRYCSIGRTAIANQLGKLSSEAEGVLANRDVECVHKMRVASRRVRTALAVFEDCFPGKRFDRWSKRMKRVTKELGEARDLDVQILYLQEMLRRATESESIGIEQTLARKVGHRRSLQARLAGTVGDLINGDALREMRRATAGKARASGSWGRSRALAYMHVLRRTTELLSYASYVHDERQKKRHHQTRIAAKHLRYTLELFDPLFEEGLGKEIEEMKALQDALGEMHDCDVWMGELKSRLAGESERGRGGMPGLELLLKDRSEVRAAKYRDFVSLWERHDRERLLGTMLDRLRDQASPHLTPEETFSAAIELRPSTKIAVIGDIHANAHALKAVLDDARGRGTELILNTGDTVGYGPCPAETIGLLKMSGALSVIGNFDLKVLRSKGRPGPRKDRERWYAENWTYQQLSEDDRTYLEILPSRIVFEAAGRKVMVVHGSPDSMDEYVDENTQVKRLQQMSEDTGVDVLIAGHAHRSLNRVVAGTRFINPGSVGRQDDGDPRAAYAVLSLRPLRARHYRVEYDIQAAVDQVRSRGLPRPFESILMEGRPLSHLQKKGESVERPALGDPVAACWALNATLMGGDPHSRKVAELALQLFDCLRGLHHLGEEERGLLECAAACHDLGWIEGRSGHHKASMRIVLEEGSLPLEKRERVIVALVARYHRKALPDRRHAHYCNLDRKDQQVVRKLASIMRVADGLDYSHRGVLGSVDCDHDAESITLHLRNTADPEMEENEASKKGDLMRGVFHRKLILAREG